MIIFLRFAKLSKTSSEREILRQQIQADWFRRNIQSTFNQQRIGLDQGGDHIARF